MRRRSGTTLVEVLVAIFVMGIGMIALLTLFPIGVLRMAQAINDERASQSAINADKNAIVYNIRNDALVVAQANDPYNKNTTNADLFLNPYPFQFGVALPGLPNADAFGESYVLFVDPIGANSGATSPWVGGATGLLRRRGVSFAANQTSIAQAFTLWDDITFNGVYEPVAGTLPGTPETVGANLVMRNTRFSWGYTMRRPMTAEKSVVDCSIVVFDSRSLSLGANLGLGEYVYQTSYFNPNNNTVIIDYTLNTPPPIRPGNWIMDATQYTTTNAAGVTVGSQHNYWYRVLASQDVATGGRTYAVYEIQGQLRGFNNFPTASGLGVPTPGLDPTTGESAFAGAVVILDGVAEVFEKGPARTP